VAPAEFFGGKVFAFLGPIAATMQRHADLWHDFARDQQADKTEYGDQGKEHYRQ
jgi:hypothetical protein